ncbi:uncharacterized protein LOC131637150 [Vicia villosa]|uniref:uncharacterized protein LOC131637150 n=1 Tax=Vicia villosa TaxID=3911 RepID=UPI00273CEA5C|nr:uncharacterized protein LOC131637150 [Vicia villosa]
MFYSNVARPRAKFQLWLLFMGRLATKDRLTRFGVKLEKSCTFCLEDESIDHLFFSCRKTNTIWQTILQWIGYSRTPRQWSEEKRWLIQESNRKGWKRQLLKVALAETIYFLWKARNDHIFNQIDIGSELTSSIKTSIVTRSSLSKHLRGHVNVGNMSIS